MKKTVISLFAICASVFAGAQMMPDSTVQIVAYWSKGDKISYECASSQYVIDADGNKKVDYATSETRTFEVIDADDSSYTVRLSYSDVFSPAPVNYLTEAQVKELGEAFVITFKTDELGSFTGFVDDDESFNTYSGMVDTIIENAWKENRKDLKGVSKEQFAESIKAPLCNKEYLYASMLADFNPLLMFHGCRLDTTTVYSFPQDFTTIYNSDKPLQLETQFWVDEKLTDTTAVVIRTDAYAGNDIFGPMVRDHTFKMAKSTLDMTGTPYTDAEIIEEVDKMMEENAMSTSLEEYTTLQVHLDTGWPICWYSTREVLSSNNQTEAKIVIEKSAELQM